MQGTAVISDNIGCQNGRSIAVTNEGIFFIDDNTRTLYHMTDSFDAVSSTKGFDRWFKEEIQKNVFGKEKSFYDFNKGDLYLVWPDHCLVYNSLMKEFVSFYSYENVPAMFNAGNKFYCLNWYYNTLDDNYTSLYNMFEGDYNKFFGVSKPVYINFMSNEDVGIDKIFSSIESRMDVWVNENIITDKHFDYVRAYNEYQDTGTVNISTTYWNKSYIPGNSKKKFRVWAIDMPRNENSMDRIRNTWANIELGFTPPLNTNPATVITLAGTNNPNIAKYYNGIGDSNIGSSNVTSMPMQVLGTSSFDYSKMKILIHDINVKYLI